MQDKLHKLFTIVILCLCLQSLLIAPVFQDITNLMFEMPEAEIDPLEFEEDLLFVTLGGIAYAGPLFSKLMKKRLDLQNASLMLDFPPPR